MRSKLIAGNWKLNGSLKANEILVSALRSGLEGVGCEVALIPPFPYLGQVSALLSGTPIALGAQTVSEFSGGAYTGEVSAAMLADMGCRYVLVGHSERRSLFGETDLKVVEKFRLAREQGLVPVLCVGETLEERRAGRTEAVVSAQVRQVMDALGVPAFSGGVVAYEPVWAIGSGQSASPSDIQSVHAMIRGVVATGGEAEAASLRIVYGGSLKPASASAVFAQPDVDGGLVGGASLVPGDFLEICRAAI